eukprot:221553_1
MTAPSKAKHAVTLQKCDADSTHQKFAAFKDGSITSDATGHCLTRHRSGHVVGTECRGGDFETLSAKHRWGLYYGDGYTQSYYAANTSSDDKENMRKAWALFLKAIIAICLTNTAIIFLDRARGWAFIKKLWCCKRGGGSGGVEE